MSIIVALVALHAYNARRIQAEDFALGKQNTSRTESWDGLPMTAHSVAGVMALVRDHQFRDQAKNGSQPRKVGWFGNSQLHTINQFKQGQHLAPFWLRQLSDCGGCIQPLGLSLANANPQEVRVLSTYVAHELPLAAVIYEVEFMGFREDALRGEFKLLADHQPLLALLGDAPASQELKALAALRNDKDGVAKEREDGAAAVAFQERVESRLSEGLGEVSQLWADRAHLRTTLLGDLFTLRNRVFHISSQSQRKIIRPRYVRNMEAFEAMLAHFEQARVPVVLYFAPIRGDKPLPYDHAEFREWQSDVHRIAHRHGARLLNLSSLVPAQAWGSNFGEDIDFMHFQEPGHRLVAQALWPEVRDVLGL
ncbi:MAG: hypothetical protein QM742_11820 [Aquabacterium sp.]